VIVANVMLAAVSGAFSELLIQQRQRWALLRASFILQAERSWLGGMLKHRQLATVSRFLGTRYSCLGTLRPAVYCEPSLGVDEAAAQPLRHVRAYFITLLVSDPLPVVLRAHETADGDETGPTLDDVDKQLQLLSEALERSVRRRNVAEQRTQEALRGLIAERMMPNSSTLSEQPPAGLRSTKELPTPAKLPAPHHIHPSAGGRGDPLRYRGAVNGGPDWVADAVCSPRSA
jgi:hypothetical protein